MKVSEARKVVGGLSNPSKMPCKSYGLPAAECKLGALLAKRKGSTCSDCYALKGRYVMPNVQEAQYRRLAALRDPRWVDAIALLIEKQGSHFRWHDSGDLQSELHLQAIVQVCEATPSVRHWLPTREAGTIKRYLAEGGSIPANLTVRISAPMRDSLPAGLVKLGLPTSTVHDTAGPIGQACIAPQQDGFCGDCRACWDRKVDNISYHRH